MISINIFSDYLLQFCRYEKGLEDYDEEMNSNIFQEDQNKYKSLSETHEISNLEIFKDILIGLYEIGTYNIETDDNMENETGSAEDIGYNNTIIYNITDVRTEEFSPENSTESLSRHSREVGTARLKGQAFNGYYDFVINEGSYKFWAAFQVRLY